MELLVLFLLSGIPFLAGFIIGDSYKKEYMKQKHIREIERLEHEHFMKKLKILNDLNLEN